MSGLPCNEAPVYQLCRKSPDVRTESYNARSRFIKEIPDEVMQEIRMTAKIGKPVSSTGSRIAPGAALKTIGEAADIGLVLASVSNTVCLAKGGHEIRRHRSSDQGDGQL